MTPISLEMNNTLTNCDTGYVEIRCAVDDNLMAEILSISLIRHEKIASIVLRGGELKDTEIQSIRSICSVIDQ